MDPIFLNKLYIQARESLSRKPRKTKVTMYCLARLVVKGGVGGLVVRVET